MVQKAEVARGMEMHEEVDQRLKCEVEENAKITRC
jgi:hypothetical protein